MDLEKEKIWGLKKEELKNCGEERLIEKRKNEMNGEEGLLMWFNRANAVCLLE